MAADIMTLEQRLVRYLKTGTDGTKFLPGRNKTFKPNVMTQMIEAGQGMVAIAHMKRINTEHAYYKREPYLFYLAIATHSDNLEIKQAAYALVPEVCETPVDLFLFLKRVRIISVFRKGWGAGLRKAVCSWYNSRDPMVLAELVTRYKSIDRWSHKDVFRLCHIKPANEGIGFIVKVVCKGLKVAKENTPEPSEDIQKLIDYFEAVEFIRHSEDGTAVALKMEEKNLHFEHIPSNFLSSKEVWNSLLLKMSLTQLLGHLPSLSRRGFLAIPQKDAKSDPLTKQIQERVLEKLKDAAVIEQEKINPYLMYISIRNYVRTFSDKKKYTKSGQADAEPKKRSAEPQTEPADHSKKKKKKKKKKKGEGDEKEEKEIHIEPSVNDKAKKHNPDLFDALHGAFRIAVEKNLLTTGKTYCMAVKASLDQLNKGLLGIPSVSPLEIMALTATFLKKEKSSQLGFFTASYSPMKFPSELEDMIQEIAQLAAPIPDLACDPAAVISWALEKKKKFDVFLVVSDGNECKGETSPAELLDEYRTTMNLPNTKMIINCLTSTKLEFATSQGMLDIGGFDSTVPTIINEFITGKLDQ